MDVTKELLEYVVQKDDPTFINGEDGYRYSNRKFERIDDRVRFPKFGMRTLQSLKDYMESNPDGLAGHYIFLVENPETVTVYSSVDGKRHERDVIISLDPQIPKITTGSYMEREKFIIQMQSCFLPYESEPGHDDREDIIALCSKVKVGTVSAYNDNGCFQKCTVEDGIIDEKEVAVPGIVALVPFSTFPEVAQPVRNFLFRMKDSKYSESGAECALFDADGGVWKNNATKNIAEWIRAQIVMPEGVSMTVLY